MHVKFSVGFLEANIKIISLSFSGCIKEVVTVRKIHKVETRLEEVQEWYNKCEMKLSWNARLKKC